MFMDVPDALYGEMFMDVPDALYGDEPLTPDELAQGETDYWDELHHDHQATIGDLPTSALEADTEPIRPLDPGEPLGCNGGCLSGADVGFAGHSHLIAVADPDCPLHGPAGPDDHDEDGAS
jgi:hypothetical protein